MFGFVFSFIAAIDFCGGLDTTFLTAGKLSRDGVDSVASSDKQWS